MKSKFLNQTFNGWKVTDMTKLESGHTTFTLTKKLNGKPTTITLSDNDMTALSRGKTVEALLVGKVNAIRK